MSANLFALQADSLHLVPIFILYGSDRVAGRVGHKWCFRNILNLLGACGHEADMSLQGKPIVLDAASRNANPTGGQPSAVEQYTRQKYSNSVVDETQCKPALLPSYLSRSSTVPEILVSKIRYLHRERRCFNVVGGGFLFPSHTLITRITS